MSLASLFRQPVTVEHTSSTGIDNLGNEIPGVVSTTSTFGYAHQVDADEVTVDQRTYRVDWEVFLPRETVIDGGDSVLIPGPIRLFVVGPPEQVRNPRTATYSHVRFKARSVTG